MTTALLDLLADGTHDAGRARFFGEAGAGAVPLPAVWAASERAAGWVRAHAGTTPVVAATLEASLASVAALVGAWRAGARVVSLPAAARGQAASAYRAQITEACVRTGATLLLVADPTTAADLELPIESVGFDTVIEGPAFAEHVLGGDLVQFSSGTTGSPKGIVLSLAAIGANVAGILDRLDLGGPGVSCSWLPLSHDMGLIGMCLVPWAAFGPRWQGAGEMVLIPTASFARNPSIWMRACSDFGATVTTAPTFAYELVARRLSPSRPLDLHSLRACIVGAEPVRADALRRFATAGEPFGLHPDAICPAYGMAEASLAVSLHPPGSPWQSIEVDGKELVGCGRPLGRTQVEVDPASGALRVRGPSLFEGYIGEQPRAGEWFETRDLGVLVADTVHVQGRVDDLLFIAGTKVSAVDVEQAAGRAEGARSDSAAAVQVTPSTFVVVVERKVGGRARAAADALGRAVRTEVVGGFGRGPAEVVVVAPGTLPRTASGKIQRHLVRDLIGSGGLEVDARLVFRAPRTPADGQPENTES